MDDAVKYGLLGGLVAVLLEFSFKKWGTSYVRIAWFAVPAAILVNYCIYKIVRASSNLPAVTVVFSCVTFGLRILLSLWQGWAIGKGTWAAVALMLLALLCRMWKP